MENNVEIGTADLLEKAIEILETEEWVKGSYAYIDKTNKKHHHCAVGAIECAMMRLTGHITDSSYNYAVREVRRVLSEKAYIWSVEKWNDYVAKNKEDVIDLFTSVVKDLRNQ